VDGIASVRDDNDVQTMADQAGHHDTPLAIVPACIVLIGRRLEIDLRHDLKRQASFRDVFGVLRGLERDPHVIYRYSYK
jgi:hypothetical protein